MVRSSGQSGRQQTLSAEGADSPPPVLRPRPLPAAPTAMCPATVRAASARGEQRPDRRRPCSQRRVSCGRQRSLVRSARSRLPPLLPPRCCPRRRPPRRPHPRATALPPCLNPRPVVPCSLPTSLRPATSFTATCSVTVRATSAREGPHLVLRDSRKLASGGARPPFPSLLPRSCGLVRRDVLHGGSVALSAEATLFGVLYVSSSAARGPASLPFPLNLPWHPQPRTSRGPFPPR